MCRFVGAAIGGPKAPRGKLEWFLSRSPKVGIRASRHWLGGLAGAGEAVPAICEGAGANYRRWRRGSSACESREFNGIARAQSLAVAREMQRAARMCTFRCPALSAVVVADVEGRVGMVNVVSRDE